MAKLPQGPDDALAAPRGRVPDEILEDWFASEVLPLEASLTRMLRRHWRRPDDIADLRQEIYIRVYESAARDGLPEFTPAWVFRCARNHLINKARRAQVVSIDLVAELDDLADAPVEQRTPERMAAVHADLELVEAAIEALPPRCREVMVLRTVEGLTQKEIATRLGIVEGTVEKQVTLGIRALAETLSERGVDAATGWMRRWGRQVIKE